MGFAILVTLYFWHSNRIGIPFSSGKALRIMQITAVMVVILIGWSLLTIHSQGARPIPLPTMDSLKFSDEALGWLKGTAASKIAVVAMLIGLGHSLLAMSGEESLAQVYREIAAPKLRNLGRSRHFRVQPAIHLAGIVLRCHDRSRQPAQQILR